MLSRAFTRPQPGALGVLPAANFPVLVSPVGSFSEDCLFDFSSSPLPSSLALSGTMRQTTDESTTDLFQAEGLEDEPEQEVQRPDPSGSLRGLAGMTSAAPGLGQAAGQLKHQFPLFGWNYEAPSMPEIRSMLNKADSSAGLGSMANRCISAVDNLDSLDQASGMAALRLQHSLPRAISTGEAAALGSRMARHSGEADAGIPMHIGSLSLHMPAQHARDEATFRPPHEVAASLADVRTVTHSLTRHKTTADRLASVVFEQTGLMCSGASSLRPV